MPTFLPRNLVLSPDTADVLGQVLRKMSAVEVLALRALPHDRRLDVLIRALGAHWLQSRPLTPPAAPPVGD